MEIVVDVDSTNLSYWLNWRFLMCAIWVTISLAFAVFLMWKYESQNDPDSKGGGTPEITHFDCCDKAWKPCLEQIHPLWLLAFRMVSFSVLLTTLVIKILQHGVRIFFFYTQWTFTLVTIYFGLASILSIKGCYLYHKYGDGYVSQVRIDEEQGSYVTLPTNAIRMKEKSCHDAPTYLSQDAGLCHLLEIIFQINCGAVMLTDSIYWSVIFPFLTIKDYPLNFMTVNMHTVNAILLLGDATLNCLMVPWYRISFFILWTSAFVIFQWTLHAYISIQWPYPFLDLSSPYAPLWYFSLGLLHVPCYGIFAFIVKTKHSLFLKLLPRSYQCCDSTGIQE